MKRILKNTFIATSALMGLLLSSCEKSEVKQTVDNPITIGATYTETKALLTNTTFNSSGNRAIIYDFVDGNYYFSDLIGPDVDGNTYGFEGVWPFVNGPHQWTPGVHKFFGWLVNDANGTDNTSDDLYPALIFGNDFNTTTNTDKNVTVAAFNNATRTLTIPTTTIDHESKQFDFMYSNIVSSEPQNATVNLKFNHLFTAVSFGVENSTSSYITINDFKIERIPSTRSAQINFSGSSTIVNYSESTNDVFSRGLDDGKGNYIISPKNLRSNIFNGSTTQEFMMLWPVEAENLYSTNKITTEEGVVKYPEDWKMYIKYTADGKTYEKRMNFPNASWDAGKKYYYNIVFADKMVELKVKVTPWEYEEQDIDYSDNAPSLSGGGALAWNESISIVDKTNKMVSIVNAQPAEAMFTLQSPIGGSWIVSLVGDVNAFEVSPLSGIIDNQTATIYVKPLITSPVRDYKVQLKFTVRRSDGRMIAADDIIQANGKYTIVLPRNN